MAKLTPEAEQAIKDAVAIVASDKQYQRFNNFMSNYQPKTETPSPEPTPRPDAPTPPPADPAPEVPVRRGGYWGELVADDE